MGELDRGCPGQFGHQLALTGWPRPATTCSALGSPDKSAQQYYSDVE
jgi:hypothetical protein